MPTDNQAFPFLRWAGGKRWLAKHLGPILSNRLKESGGIYFEPFLGSASMFFSVSPEHALLSDINKDLIATYKQVASHHEILKKKLHSFSATKTQYYVMRNLKPVSAFERAVRLIYLNRNCYGGIYRENRKGIFNVPYGGGSRNHIALAKNGFLPNAAEALSKPGIRLLARDFEGVISEASEGDVVYCDPTYQPVTRMHFDRYGKTIFDWEDQERLAKSATAAYERGALVIVSNASYKEIAQLYPSSIQMKIVRRKGLGPKCTSQELCEYLFILDPKNSRKEWITLRETGLAASKHKMNRLSIHDTIGRTKN
jgi:DNA adenine methylase